MEGMWRRWALVRFLCFRFCCFASIPKGMTRWFSSFLSFLAHNMVFLGICFGSVAKQVLETGIALSSVGRFIMRDIYERSWCDLEAVSAILDKRSSVGFPLFSTLFMIFSFIRVHAMAWFCWTYDDALLLHDTRAPRHTTTGVTNNANRHDLSTMYLLGTFT